MLLEEFPSAKMESAAVAQTCCHALQTLAPRPLNQLREEAMENKRLAVAQLYHPSAFVTLNLLLRDAKSCLYLAHSEIHHSLQIFPLLKFWIFSPVYKSVLPKCCHCQEAI